MFPVAREVRLTPEGRAALESRLRARIVVLAADGVASRAIARNLRLTPRTANLRRIRFAEAGLDRLADKSRRGRQPSSAQYDASTDRRILALLDRPPSAGHAHWTGKLQAAALGDVSEQYVWRFLRRRKIDLDGPKSWCVSHAPEFVARLAEIVGRYLDPPDDTTALCAALDIATSQVTTGRYRRRRRIEFLDFMNRVVADHPDRETRVVLGDLNTHKPKRDLCLARQPKVHFQFMSTHACWMNQVQLWFSIHTRAALAGARFTSPLPLINQLDAFLDSYNTGAKPFSRQVPAVQQKHFGTRLSHP